MSPSGNEGIDDLAGDLYQVKSVEVQESQEWGTRTSRPSNSDFDHDARASRVKQ